MLRRLWLLVGSDRPTDRQCQLLSCPGQLKRAPKIAKICDKTAIMGQTFPFSLQKSALAWLISAIHLVRMGMNSSLKGSRFVRRSLKAIQIKVTSANNRNSGQRIDRHLKMFIKSESVGDFFLPICERLYRPIALHIWHTCNILQAFNGLNLQKELTTYNYLQRLEKKTSFGD